MLYPCVCRTSCIVSSVTVVATMGGALGVSSLTVDISLFTAFNIFASKSSSCQVGEVNEVNVLSLLNLPANLLDIKYTISACSSSNF